MNDFCAFSIRMNKFLQKSGFCSSGKKCKIAFSPDSAMMKIKTTKYVHI